MKHTYPKAKPQKKGVSKKLKHKKRKQHNRVKRNKQHGGALTPETIEMMAQITTNMGIIGTLFDKKTGIPAQKDAIESIAQEVKLLVSTLENKINIYYRIIDEVTTKLVSEAEKDSTLTVELADIKQKLDAAEKAHADSKERVQQVSREAEAHEKMRLQETTSKETLQIELKQSEEAAEERARAQRAAMAAQQEKAAAARTAAVAEERAKAEAAQAEAEGKSKAQIQEINAAASAAEEASKTAQAKAKAATEELDKAKQAFEKQQRDLEGARKAHETALRETADVRARQEEATRKLAATGAQVAALRNEQSIKQKDLDSCISREADLKQQLAAAIEKKTTVEKDVQQLIEHITETKDATATYAGLVPKLLTALQEATSHAKASISENQSKMDTQLRGANAQLTLAKKTQFKNLSDKDALLRDLPSGDQSAVAATTSTTSDKPPNAPAATAAPAATDSSLARQPQQPFSATGDIRATDDIGGVETQNPEQKQFHVLRPPQPGAETNTPKDLRGGKRTRRNRGIRLNRKKSRGHIKKPKTKGRRHVKKRTKKRKMGGWSHSPRRSSTKMSISKSKGNKKQGSSPKKNKDTYYS